MEPYPEQERLVPDRISAPNQPNPEPISAVPVAADVVSAAETLRICTACARNLPPSAFKRRSRKQGQRLTSWCRDCINASNRERDAHRQTMVLGKVQQRIHSHSKASRVESVISAACRKAGGVEAFAGRLAESLHCGDPIRSHRAVRLLINLVIAQDRLANGEE